MSLKIPLFSDPLIITHKGIYDFEGLYQLLHRHLREKYYDISEPKYKDKSGGFFGNEIEIKIKGEKKVTEFVKYYVTLETWKIEMKEFDAKVDGTVKKVTDGRLKVVITDIIVEFDWQDKFKTGKLKRDAGEFQKLGHWIKDKLFGEGLLKFLVNKALKRYYEIHYMGPLEGEVLELHEKIKKHLRLTGAEL